jgi:predicted restriction endonuclease
MTHFVADDIIAVLAEIRHHFDLNRSDLDVEELRKQAIRSVARIEVDAGRFVNDVSAQNSIHDACVRRLGYMDVADFDRAVDEWLSGRSDALRVAVLTKVTKDAQRQGLAEVLGISDSRPANAAVQDLESPPADRVLTTVSRILRDTGLSNRVKVLHNYECQICGYTLLLADGSRYAEGHHVQPLGSPHNGPDVLGNIVCLCPNHHAACDLGAITLVADELRHAIGHHVERSYIDYHNSVVYRGNNSAELDDAREWPITSESDG